MTDTRKDPLSERCGCPPITGFSEVDAIGAIRLAMEAGADARTRSAVIREILKRAPLTDPANVSSVNLLIRAVRTAKAEFRITDHEPQGRLVKAGGRS